MVSRPRVLKSSSGLLYDALAGVYSSLGFHRPRRQPRHCRTGLGSRYDGSCATLKPLRSATVEINGVTTTIPPALGLAEAAILNAMQAPTERH